MSIHELREMLMWCTVINFGILLFWVLALFLARDLVFRIHSALFKVSPETLSLIHYAGLGIFKLLWLFLNLAPFVALTIVGN